jgi:sedoheptulokinase
MKSLTLGIDIGSSSTKALLYDPQSSQSVKAFSETLSAKVEDIPSGYREENPEIVFTRTCDLIRTSSKFAEEMGCQIKRIAFTGQMHGGLFVDRDLNPLSNFITWQDKRADEILQGSQTRLIEEIRASLPAEEWLDTGGRIFTGFLGATACWFLRNKKVPHNTAKMLGIYDWVASRLLGSKATTDPSSASAWGMYSIREGSWSKAILGVLGIPEKWLPEVLESGTVIGTVLNDFASQLNLPNTTEVVRGTGDTQASYLGSGCKSDELLLNFGTGSQAMWEADAFATYPNTDTRYLSPGRFLITIPTLAGGLAFSLLADFFAETLKSLGPITLHTDILFQKMTALAMDASADADGVTLNSFFNGHRFLGENLHASINGLTPANFNVPNVLRAMLNGMVDELALPYFAAPSTIRRHQVLLGSGNGMRKNAALRHVAEQRFRMPLRLSPVAEEAALGAAILASF